MAAGPQILRGQDRGTEARRRENWGPEGLEYNVWPQSIEYGERRISSSRGSGGPDRKRILSHFRGHRTPLV